MSSKDFLNKDLLNKDFLNNDLLNKDLLKKDLLNSVNNQLTVVMAQAELLARNVESSQEAERCQKINQAACNITRLLQAFVADSRAAASAAGS
jgi:hypothetical protein